MFDKCVRDKNRRSRIPNIHDTFVHRSRHTHASMRARARVHVLCVHLYFVPPLSNTCHAPLTVFFSLIYCLCFFYICSLLSLYPLFFLLIVFIFSCFSPSILMLIRRNCTLSILSFLSMYYLTCAII